MPAKYVNDGDFSVAKQNGATEYNYPFLNKGDDQSFEAVITRRQDAVSYRKPVAMTPLSFSPNGIPVQCYLVDQTKPQNIQQGLLEWKETYAMIPNPRSEYSSITWPYQILSTMLPYAVSEIQLNLGCRIYYEYSLTEFDLAPAPTVQVVTISGITYAYKFGGWGDIVPGSSILAKGQEQAIYKCGIFQRTSIYIIAPTAVT